MKLFSSLLASTALADVYMHFPRGSNNRLNENSEGRRNANRLFDSQNNNEGGYNVGDRFDTAAKTADEQSKAVFFESTSEAASEIAIEWWNQHGCGKRDENDANWVNCQIVLQYMCEDSSSTKIQNGLNTNTPAYRRPNNDESQQQYAERRRKDTTDNDHAERGVHESWEYYDSCYKRDRNYGLFTGNEGRVRGGAIYTRQNPGGTRRGYECPEERDYYPYWHPNPWKDIAVLTSEPEKCQDLTAENGNRNMKYECVHKIDENTTLGYSKYNNQEECEHFGGEWVGFYNAKFIFEEIEDKDDCDALAKDSDFKNDIIWGIPYRTGEGRRAAPQEKCLLLEEAPECKKAPWSRANHLGQIDDTDYFPTYKWELPNFHSLLESQECVLRIRYNITTNDYVDDFASENRKAYFPGLESHDDPEVTYRGARLQLALDSAQTGRVFQDRSHIFQLKPRPQSVPSDKIIKNLGVRGRRGNIVQAFPSVEYDFSPTILEMNQDDLVHIQWEGSNTNPNSDGEGRQGTDRSNIVPITVPGASIPAGTPSFPNNELDEDYFQYTDADGTVHTFRALIVRDSSFPEIVQQCEAAKMNLPEPTTQEYNDALVQFWTRNGQWRGDLPIGMAADWASLSSGETASFHQFRHQRPPIGEIDHYAMIDSRGKWYDDMNEHRVFSRALCFAEISETDFSEEPKMFAEWIWSAADSIKKLNNTEDLELQLATSGYYECSDQKDCAGESLEEKEALNDKLNNAPAYFAGNIVRMNPGVHQYLSTRNNNFSNRAQKGTIIVN
ncbi:Oidioi.mRNA.OKI2018_I69.PAR.g10109.t1.cds [Oikopleura dioica]|uniref:Oidioi.mRNA.OKI2018_I69.PAR.g10109.t1.cds n=1 Tax=Oikopleura dioica TaxID=34765 RepID=A0ABN7RNX7_OIKDI|nr:Oidioi.mRNA.OKI2018_I69.PAR.g10109.t1.cds [Oikopleura dioica]